MGLDKLIRKTLNTRTAGHWRLPAALLLLALVMMFAGESGREELRFDRAGIAAGHVWRLLTGHFVHLGWPHFALNAAGLVLVWFLVGRNFRLGQWCLVAAICIMTMDAGLWLLEPQLSWYVGLSGLLHGVLAAGLVARLGKPDIETMMLTAILLGKLLWEQLLGPLPGSESAAGGAVVVDAHLFGALGGACAAIAIRIRVRLAAPI